MKHATAKGFDCVEFKRKAQEKVYEETKGLNPKEQVAYFRRAARSGPLADWWKRLKRA